MKITFLQTGGTIDKDYPQAQKGWAFEIGEPAVYRIIQHLNPSFAYEVLSILKKDSLEMTQEDRALILSKCQAIENDKIIITHGTDTMLQTAQVLAEVNDKTIVLTGSMRPERFANTDAPINVGLAIAAVQVLPAGVYVAMNGLVLLHNQITRNKETVAFVKAP